MEGIAIVGAGSQACTVGTEHEVAVDSVGGVYSAVYDTTALATGDTLEVATYVRLAAGGGWLLVDKRTHTGAQAIPGKDLDGRAVVGPYGVRLTVKQTAGTGRTIPYVSVKISP